MWVSSATWALAWAVKKIGVAMVLVCASFVLWETPAASCRLVNEICRLEKVNERSEDPRDLESRVNQVHC